MDFILKYVRMTAQQSYLRPRAVVCGWLLLLVVSATLYVVGGSKTLEIAEGFVGDSGVAEVLESSHDFKQSRTETLLIEGPSKDLDEAASNLTDRLNGASYVAEVGPVETGRSGNTRLVSVVLEAAKVSPTMHVSGLADAIRTTNGVYDTVEISPTGPISVQADVTQKYADRLTLLEILSLPITALVLYLVFAGLVAASIPLVTGVCVVVVAMAASGITSYLVPADPNQPSLILLMGLALGVDYSLFFVRRAREEFARAANADQAAEIAVSRTTRSVFMAGLTTGVSVLPLFLTEVPIFHSFALGIILVVTAALLGSVTLLPALMRLGRRRIVGRTLGRQRVADNRIQSFLARVLHVMLEHPVRASVFGTAALLLMAAPLLGMRLEVPGTDSLSRGFTTLATLDRVNEDYPLYGVSHTATRGVDEAGEKDAVMQLESLVAAAAQTPGFDPRTRAVEVSEDGQVARVEIGVEADGIESPAAKESLATLRNELVPLVGGEEAVSIGGETAISVDYSAAMVRDLMLVVPIVMLISFTVIALSFRSVMIGALSVFLNLLSVLAAYGLMVLIFQLGWGAPILGEDSVGAVVTLLPLILFVILFGLSMDYHILILSRVQEAMTDRSDLRGAVHAGLLQSAAPVTAAAFVMIVIFLMFTILPTQEMKQLGTGLAIAILLDATLVRVVLLPSMLLLLGKRPWRSRLGAKTENAVTPAESPAEEARSQ